jgi:hypothetical protein
VTDPTQVLADLERTPLAAAPRPDPLRRWLILDCLFLFALLGIAALLTPIPWLALTETIGACASLIAAGCYSVNRGL